MKKMQICVYAVLVICLIANNVYHMHGRRHRILLDTDVDVDDVLALLYILKLDRSIFDLKAITISTNSWTNAGHAISEVYDLLYMMGRDDISVGVGGDGGILEGGTILPNVGGYLPMIDQGCDTVGYTRYSQVIPLGLRGRLDIDTKYGIKKSFLPQSSRRYTPLIQPTTQQVMIDTISAGPTTIFLISPTTNLAIFLMSNPHLKKNIKGIYILGGSVGPRLVGCPAGSASTCPSGNVYTGDDLAPNSEYNFFSDPFAAYQVMHSGIPITLVPLGCTDTIPITPEFLEEFEKNQKTFEAQYCFNALKMVRDTWLTDQFYRVFFMWDSLLVGMATSTMLKPNNKDGENEFVDVAYKRITVVTSNEPYGISDGSNPLFPYRSNPEFNLTRNGAHSGHVVTGLGDTFCVARNGCKDGYTPEIDGPEGVRVLVATRAKPNPDRQSKLDKAFYKHFLDVMNRKNQTGKFNYTTQFPEYRNVSYIPDFKGRKLGKTVVFDMDMSPGDLLALIYLLKVPVEDIHLKAIFVTPTGWASGATIDVVYDILHIMKRDDILVGLGDLYATNLTHPSFNSIGSSKYRSSIQRGAGGLLDSDTLYGLASYLHRGPRRYTAENSVEYGAPRDTSHPELRQPLALEVWSSVKTSLESGSKVTILTNGPLTSLAQIIRSDKGSTSFIQEVIVVGGHLRKDTFDRGNVVNVPCNKYAELNMYLDPLAAKTVFDSGLKITLVPLKVQRKVQCFSSALKALDTKNTPEASFTKELLSIFDNLNNTNPRYSHLGMFLGEVVGSVILGGQDSFRKKVRYLQKKVKVSATGDLCEDGEMSTVGNYGKSLVRILKRLAPSDVYNSFAIRVGAREQSAGFKSFFNVHRKVSKKP